jgi:NADH-quinone oxidoreductase subunit N
MVILAVLNAVISIFYYFRVIVAMFFKDEDRAELTVPIYYKVVLGFAALATIVIGVCPSILSCLL